MGSFLITGSANDTEIHSGAEEKMLGKYRWIAQWRNIQKQESPAWIKAYAAELMPWLTLKLPGFPRLRSAREMSPTEIKTEYVYPPIASRQFDWCATYGDYDLDDPRGWGATEQEAIDDLILNHPRNGDR